MRKTIVSALVCFCFYLLATPAQAQQWQWGKTAQNFVKEIATDIHRNSYVIWSVGAQANIDGHPIPVAGSTDIAVTSFRCDGTYRWTKVIGTAGPDASQGIATDSMGGLYILAYLGSGNASDIYIDDDDTLSPTLRKIMLIKYDTAGNYLWSRMPEADTLSVIVNSGGFNLSVEPNGTAHIMSLLAPGVYGNGGYTATYPEGQNLYSLQYDKNGNFLNGIHFDVTRPPNSGVAPFGFTMIYDAPRNRYYWPGMRYDPFTISFGSTNITGGNFLACFDQTGNVIWTKKSNNDAITTWLTGKPAIDHSGNIYVTGFSYNDFNGGAGDGFGSFSFNNTMGVWGFPILVKFNTTGNVLFATNASDNSDNAGVAIAYVNGTVAVAGQYAGGNFNWDGATLGPNGEYYDVFLARFDTAAGNIIGIDTLSSGPGVDEYVRYLTTDVYGNFYLGGDFNGNINIAGTTYTKQDGNTDGFLAKFGSANCTCTLPVSNFTQTGSGMSYNFSYNGTVPIDSVVWTFGDGQSATGTNTIHTYTTPGSYTVCATAYNNCGTHQHCSTVTATNINGISQQSLFSSLKAYPNPAQEMLYLTGMPAAATYKLYNSVGALVQSGELPAGNAQIHVGNLAQGAYILQLQDNSGHTAMISVMR